MNRQTMLASTLGLLALSTVGWGTTAVAQGPEVEMLNLESRARSLSSLDLTTLATPQEEPSADPTMDQVTSVSQLSDVQPTDWAFQALQSLVERYGVIAGYPDGTFRGNRALTRYEFAAGLNAALDRVNELIAAGTADLVTKEDLATLQRLQEEFAAELATLRGRVDALEGRTANLEAQQFSTTTKLFGQVVVGLQGRTNSTVQLAGFRFPDNNDNINVISNVQLSLLTQFNERSILLTGLQAGNGTLGNPLLSNDFRLGYEGNTNNSLVLSDLTYRQLFGNNFAVIVGPAGVNMVNVFRGANRVESAGRGPLSRFAQRNPILNIGNGTGGLGFDWQIVPSVSLQAVYSASIPNNPTFGGLLGGTSGETSTGLQLNWAPIDTLDIAINYINAYSPFGRLGTAVGDDQVVLSSDPLLRAPIQTNAVGANISWQALPSLTVGGWFGYTTSSAISVSGSVETINWMAFLNFPDLFGDGNLGGIYVGQPPRITSSNLPIGNNIPNFVSQGGFGSPGGQPGSTTHVEAFYRWQITDNIAITPGVIVIFNPRNNPANSDTVTIGALRTTFSF